jgi:hypothetical protein
LSGHATSSACSDAVQDYDEWPLAAGEVSVGRHRLTMWAEWLWRSRGLTRIPDPDLPRLVVRIGHGDPLEADSAGSRRRAKEYEDRQE